MTMSRRKTERLKVGTRLRRNRTIVLPMAAASLMGRCPSGAYIVLRLRHYTGFATASSSNTAALLRCK